jgi:hypothetical protein
MPPGSMLAWDGSGRQQGSSPLGNVATRIPTFVGTVGVGGGQVASKKFVRVKAHPWYPMT